MGFGANKQLYAGLVASSIGGALGLFGMSGVIPAIVGGIGAVLIVVGGVQLLR